MTKKIKALTPEIAVAEEKKIFIAWDTEVEINGKFLSLGNRTLYRNYFDAMVDIRKNLDEMYAFLNENLGTHYVVKNDTESNLKDLGIT